MVMTREEITQQFGFDPVNVGLRHRSYWIVTEIEEDEAAVGAQLGDLCIKARDGADNPEDEGAELEGDYIGTVEDSFDPTYRYYYYRPIDY